MDFLVNRKYVFYSIFVFVGLIFSVKLFSLQILDEELQLAAQDNILQTKISYPYRGIITDRNGKILVQNSPIFDLMVIPKDVKDLDTTAFCKLVGIRREYLKRRLKEAQDYSHVKPSVILKLLEKEEVARVHDHLIDYQGFFFNVRTKREYPHSNLAHVLGYVGEINKKQINEYNTYARGRDRYKQGDYIGISGLEKTYESVLKGKRGVRHVMVDVRGIEQGTFKDGEFDTLSIPGYDMQSTIDLDLQKYGEYLMDRKRGSVVAIEPQTGEILSMVSAPDYDPNILTGRAFSDNFELIEEDTNDILFIRPIMADQYPPGSIYKLLQSLIAMQEGVITPDSRFRCNRSIIACHGAHSNEDLRGAIQHSCNPYFWNVFKKIITKPNTGSKYKDAELGLAAWRKHVLSFGLGKALGVDLANEKDGIIPSVELYDKMYGHGSWKFSTIYSLAIGQGEIGISPVQMANFVSAIANRGYYITPHLVKNISDKGIAKKYTEKHRTTIDKKYFGTVIDGMERVVNSPGGTGFRAMLDSVIVCGKTGTSQNPHGEDHSVFICFAPKDNPKIAVAVYVENSGQGARAAASIAGLMVEKYLFGGIAEKRKYIEDYALRGYFIY